MLLALRVQMVCPEPGSVRHPSAQVHVSQSCGRASQDPPSRPAPALAFLQHVQVTFVSQEIKC